MSLFVSRLNVSDPFIRTPQRYSGIRLMIVFWLTPGKTNSDIEDNIVRRTSAYLGQFNK